MKITWNVDFTGTRIPSGEMVHILSESYNSLDEPARPSEIRMPNNAMQEALVEHLTDLGLPMVGYREFNHAT